MLAANDGLGGAAISILEKNGLDGKVPVTGQDATVEGLQNVLAGTQCMTVYKSAKLEAGALADAAIALANGEEAETNGTTQDSEGGRDVPSILLDPAVDHEGQRRGRHRRRWPDGCGRVRRRSSPRRAPTPASPESGVGSLDTATAPSLRTVGAPGSSRSPLVRTHHVREARTTQSPPTVPGRTPKSRCRPPLLELRGVNKSFGVVHVLHDVDFAVYPGQVTALVGDNGAGKSTLVKVIAGIYGRDTGEYFFDGKPVERPRPPRRRRPRHRGRLPGPRAVRQPRHRPEHVPRARDPQAASSSTRLTMEARARETLASLSVRTVKSVRQSVSSLSGGQRQTVAIAKAVLWNSKVVLLDEPTAALGVAQTRQVLDLVRRLADHGLGVVLISHNMNDVLEVADRITALYLGRVAADVPAEGRHPQPDRRADHRRPLRRPRHPRTPPPRAI